ncbi:hypothetical protein SLE2022_219270 [Rubroshorea leprosula]
MFSSSNSYNPFPFVMTNQTMMTGNPSSTPGDQASSPFFNFPVPFFDDCDADGLLISQLFSQQPILGSSSNGEPSVPTAEVKKVAGRKKRSSGDGGTKVAIPRKRTGKKDRHSKIYTSQGPRDRRMRLSLQIARKFFDLQDMLGFDKASKTIEWLFSKSKAAIKEVAENFPGVKESCNGGGKTTTVSSTSESEVVSVAEETEDNGEQKGKEKKDKKSRKASTNVTVPRESREKARARARERTIEKMKKKSDESNLKDVEHFQSSSPHESGENLGGSSQTNSSWKAVIQKEDEQYHRLPMVPMPELQMDSAVSIIEKFLGVNTITPRSSSTGNYSHDIANLSIRGNSDENNSVFSESWRLNADHKMQYTYCGMTNVKEAGSSGNVIQVQNPSPIFMANLNTQEQNPSSVFMIPSRELNPNSLFMTPSNVREGNPTSVLVSTQNSGLHSHFQENQLCSNHFVANKYCNFY